MNPFKDNAVSPVVGVMLMLVVTIIIAAVVTGFAGGLVGGSSQNAPTLAMDVKIINTGSWSGSGFFATVTGVSEPIATKDIRIITAWTATNRAANNLKVNGGNTTLPGVRNVDKIFDPEEGYVGGVAPFGNGPGVNATRGETSGPTYRAFSEPRQQFGNYSLVAGTTLTATPCGAEDADSLGGSNSADQGYGIGGKYHYSAGGPWLDPATAVLGSDWELLRAGDKVNVKVVYVLSGKVIFSKNIPVTEG
ncbi:MAG: type IV pilin N-terminal domain-containing protein [Methanoregula sp.]|jgi:hypothetical protein